MHLGHFKCCQRYTWQNNGHIRRKSSTDGVKLGSQNWAFKLLDLIDHTMGVFVFDICVWVYLPKKIPKRIPPKFSFFLAE